MKRTCAAGSATSATHDWRSKKRSSDPGPKPPPRRRAVAAREVQFSRLTDFVGHKESPAISPDGKMVAFVAMVDGRRQIWVRMLAGGAALQVTRDGTDHEQPRWVARLEHADLLHAVRPAAQRGVDLANQRTRRPGAADRVRTRRRRHQPRRPACRRLSRRHREHRSVTVSRDGSHRAVVAQLPPEEFYRHPRWSPDDRSIAFQVGGIERSSSGWT